MRLIEASVKNYRSIDAQTRFEVGELTTLIGPNNEGKTNLLRALDLGMTIIERWSKLPDQLAGSNQLSGAAVSFILQPRRFNRDNISPNYSWEDDYPLAKQSQNRPQPTVIRLKFKLSEEEQSKLRKDTQIFNNGDLPIEIKLSRTSVTMSVLKPGRASATHKAKAREIARFISERLSFISIPAIRTSEQAMSLLSVLTQRRLKLALDSEEYRNLLSEISRLKNDAIEQISLQLTGTVQQYLPKVRQIRLETIDYSPIDSLGPVQIDDGLLTSLEHKGDGIKSLVTLALIQELAIERSQSQGFLLLVDEPEAHLHANAVHDLQSLFGVVAQKQQVILATHNPIFVNRDNLSSNILVENNTAHPAQSVVQIRESLGILLQDNLHSAEIVVLVEGVTDEEVIPSLLSIGANPQVINDIQSGRVTFRATKGAAKLSGHLLREKNTASKIFVVFDNDEAGRNSSTNAIEKGLINLQSVFILGNPVKKNSEFEDLFIPELYLDGLSLHFERTFVKSHFANINLKWSENFKSAISKLGIAGDVNQNIEQAKKLIVDLAKQNAGTCLTTDSALLITQLRRLIWPESG